MNDHTLGTMQPYEDGARFKFLRKAVSHNNPDAIYEYFRFEMDAETSLISSQELADCLNVLTLDQPDQAFVHTKETRLLYAQGERREALLRAASVTYSLGGCYELADFSDTLIHEQQDPDIYPVMVQALLRMAEIEPRFYYYVGRLLCSDYHPERNQREGIRMYEKGAEAGSQRCQYALCYTYLYGPYVDDFGKAIKLLRKYADAGNYRAMVKLAFYLLSDPELSDEAKAIELLKKSTAYPNPVGAYILLACYYQDKGRLDLAYKYAAKYQECTDANRWYDELITLYLDVLFELDPYSYLPDFGNIENLPLVMAHCQYIILKSEVLSDDLKPDLFILRELANRYEACGYYLALIYQNGYTVAKQPMVAATWMKKAELASFAPAMIAMAEYYEHGYYVKQSLHKAIELYEDVLEISHYRHSYVADKLARLRNLVD